jgi:lipid-A-disaccharide synthase
MGRLLYLVAGEHSGDSRGAELIAALRERRPDWEFRGLGGAKMRSLAGPGVRDWVEEAGVVGIWEVLKRYRWFKARFADTLGEIRRLAPDAVVLVDYPGFNLRLARALRGTDSGARLIGYVSPQVWAWSRGRIPRIARWLDLMLCLFEFEKGLFREAGLRTVCVGHPLVDQLEEARITGGRERELVGLFPGSREREVARLFPVMLEAAGELHREHPAWVFEASAASEPLAEAMRAMLRDAGGLPVGVVTGRSHELMQRAACGWVASGTATLEATYYGLPYCLVYKVAWPTYLAARLVMDLDHLGIANILAGREIVHEFLQHAANPGNLVSFVESVMTDRVRRRELERNLLETAALLGGRGAACRAAAAIVELLETDGG